MYLFICNKYDFVRFTKTKIQSTKTKIIFHKHSQIHNFLHIHETFFIRKYVFDNAEIAIGNNRFILTVRGWLIFYFSQKMLYKREGMQPE